MLPIMLSSVADTATSSPRLSPFVAAHQDRALLAPALQRDGLIRIDLDGRDEVVVEVAVVVRVLAEEDLTVASQALDLPALRPWVLKNEVRQVQGDRRRRLELVLVGGQASGEIDPGRRRWSCRGGSRAG